MSDTASDTISKTTARKLTQQAHVADTVTER